MLDLDQFENTAAWLEYCDGMTRFEAETEAARRQGATRWQAMQEVRNANGIGDPSTARHHDTGAARDAEGNVSRMQPRQAQEARPVSERDLQSGQRGVVLPPLRNIGRGAA